jgi:hypothetical protein
MDEESAPSFSDEYSISCQTAATEYVGAGRTSAPGQLEICAWTDGDRSIGLIHFATAGGEDEAVGATDGKPGASRQTDIAGYRERIRGRAASSQVEVNKTQGGRTGVQSHGARGAVVVRDYDVFACDGHAAIIGAGLAEGAPVVAVAPVAGDDAVLPELSGLGDCCRHNHEADRH